MGFYLLKSANLQIVLNEQSMAIWEEQTKTHEGNQATRNWFL